MIMTIVPSSFFTSKLISFLSSCALVSLCIKVKSKSKGSSVISLHIQTKIKPRGYQLLTSTIFVALCLKRPQLFPQILPSVHSQIFTPSSSSSLTSLLLWSHVCVYWLITSSISPFFLSLITMQSGEFLDFLHFPLFAYKLSNFVYCND